MLPIYSQESISMCDMDTGRNDTYINRTDEDGRKSRIQTGKRTNQNQKVLTCLHHRPRTILSFQPVRHFGHLRKYPMQDLSMFVQAGPAAVINCHHVRSRRCRSTIYRDDTQPLADDLKNNCVQKVDVIKSRK